MVQVHLIGVPLALRARNLEHGQDLVRELALVRLGAGRRDTGVPDRLLKVADEVRSVYGAFSAGPNDELDAALQRGLEFYDVTYTVPAHVGPFIARLIQVLEEAEEFCRAGRYLLTLAAPPDIAAYRRWSLGEFQRQIAGCPPLPWSRAGGEVTEDLINEPGGDNPAGAHPEGMSWTHQHSSR